jgi:hypothetical protein
MSRRKWFQMFIVTIVTALLLMFSGIVSAQGNSADAFAHVKEVQERYTDALLAREGVVGTAVGFNDTNQQAVLVLLERGGIAGIPQDLEGVPVQPVVTGVILALQKGGKPSPGQTSSTSTSYWTRPVPIGVSTGNATATNLATGTIACRVKDASGAVYALSNNHVYALENRALIGSEVLQPGLYDGGIAGVDHLGNLSAFVPIVFKGNASNRADAALALTDTLTLGTSTPGDGYGTPKATTVAPSLRTPVWKYGRTTSLTPGTITGINATVKVTYSHGVARFVGQILISPGSFSAAGDSGSLVVTQSGNNPVGLLFAGSSSVTIANNIDDVLTALGALGYHVTIDGQ